MLIFQLVESYGDDIILISEDLSKIESCIGEGFSCNLQVIVWKNGEEIFKTKVYNYDNFDKNEIIKELDDFIKNINNTGFTIICNKCGNKAKLTTKRDDMNTYDYINFDSETLYKERDGVEEFKDSIICEKCGNHIDQDY